MTKAARHAGALVALDAAPGVGSVALVLGGVVVDARVVAMRTAPSGHSAGSSDDDRLMPAVADLLSAHDLAPRDLAGVACGAGPGGFTSLRISAAIAKGLAHAAWCPLLAAPSLAWAAAVRAPGPGAWLVTLDALRGERYVARVELLPEPGVVNDGAPHGGWPVARYDYLGTRASEGVGALVALQRARGLLEIDADPTATPIATGVAALPPAPVDLASWEPAYGRLAEAQVRWEAEHGALVDATR
ncbi:hypothetical protein tb265_35730 [Gemmatimonadetes bacterium T265]|nr:hypothetical protein tb265_35730 [Gemmatimonadetes bacterium T265]